MQFMVMVKATKDSEAGVMPSEELLTAMRQVQRGAGEGRHHAGGRGPAAELEGRAGPLRRRKRTVIDGPFAETKELVAGFWIWQVRSLEEAIEWVKRCPNPMPGESEIEIRQIFEMEDFGDVVTPEVKEQEKRLRDQSEKLARKS